MCHLYLHTGLAQETAVLFGHEWCFLDGSTIIAFRGIGGLAVAPDHPGRGLGLGNQGLTFVANDFPAFVGSKREGRKTVTAITRTAVPGFAALAFHNDDTTSKPVPALDYPDSRFFRLVLRFFHCTASP